MYAIDATPVRSLWKMSHTSDSESWCSASHSCQWSVVRARNVFMIQLALVLPRRDVAQPVLDEVERTRRGRVCSDGEWTVIGSQPKAPGTSKKSSRLAPNAEGCPRWLGIRSAVDRRDAVDHALLLPNTLTIAVIVFQLRVVTGTPKSRSNVPR